LLCSSLFAYLLGNSATKAADNSSWAAASCCPQPHILASKSWQSCRRAKCEYHISIIPLYSVSWTIWKEVLHRYILHKTGCNVTFTHTKFKTYDSWKETGTQL